MNQYLSKTIKIVPYQLAISIFLENDLFCQFLLFFENEFSFRIRRFSTLQTSKHIIIPYFWEAVLPFVLVCLVGCRRKLILPKFLDRFWSM